MTGEWRTSIPESDRMLYTAAGFGRTAGLGLHPALLIIDVQYRTVGDEPLPIRQSMERYYPTSCGEAGWTAVGHIAAVLKSARSAGIPVVYPHVAPKTEVDRGRSGTKIPTLMSVPASGYQFVREIAPQGSDLLIPKRHPSAFFGTGMTSYLIDLGVDTVLLAGCTTSGCVRSTATDAFSFNFRCAVIEECVYDRSQTVHDMNLFDINSKYADVITDHDACTYLDKVGAARSAHSPVGD